MAKEKEIKIPENYQVNLNRLKRIDPKLALWTYQQIRTKMMLYFQLLDLQKSEAKAWEENNALKIELQKLEGKLNVMETTIVKLKSELEEKIKRIENIEGQLRVYVEKVGIAEQLYSTLLQQIIFLKKKIAELISEDIRDVMESYVIRIEEIVKQIKELQQPIILQGKGGEIEKK